MTFRIIQGCKLLFKAGCHVLFYYLTQRNWLVCVYITIKPYESWRWQLLLTEPVSMWTVSSYAGEKVGFLKNLHARKRNLRSWRTWCWKMWISSPSSWCKHPWYVTTCIRPTCRSLHVVLNITHHVLKCWICAQIEFSTFQFTVQPSAQHFCSASYGTVRVNKSRLLSTVRMVTARLCDVMQSLCQAVCLSRSSSSTELLLKPQIDVITWLCVCW